MNERGFLTIMLHLELLEGGCSHIRLVWLIRQDIKNINLDTSPHHPGES